MLDKQETIRRINEYSAKRIPFLFISNFKGDQNEVLTIDQIDPDRILYQVNGFTNAKNKPNGLVSTQLSKSPISFDEYQKKFQDVLTQLKKGNAYLLNLTCQTPVRGNCTLKDIFFQSKAKYKLWYEDQFVVFSPEIFVQITEGTIASHPMKGTIDASAPNAREKLLSSQKEMAEHATIVDLIRNDMSVYARNISVSEFRYIDEIITNEKHLLQVSSKITGQLAPDYPEFLGDIIFSLLPAGSITGAPKPKTMDIISQVEAYDRGFYTGIIGFFDGKNFDSGVMIRFIEQKDQNWTYKSGGGIHSLSDALSEYQEMLDKVYVPVY